MGDPANVTLDAYGPDVIFSSKVVSIDPAETIRDGVSTYKTILQFNDNDERVKPGMTANIVVTTEKKEDVVSVPQGAVISRDGKKYLKIQEGKNIFEREVQTGIVSSLGDIEIISGLSEGEVVVTSK